MIGLSELLGELRYDAGRHYRPTDAPPEPETAYLFRTAHEAGVRGIYVFEPSPQGDQHLLSPCPAVHVAEADDGVIARGIHKKLWNLGRAPFVIVRLPHQLHVYTGFDYSETDEKVGLLRELKDPVSLRELRDLLANFSADSIDSGQVWESSYARDLHPDNRVDKRLVQHLDQLARILTDSSLSSEVAHALIGKYVYLRYLHDRGFLPDKWLSERGVDPDTVFTHEATVGALRQVVEALQERLNGRVFPLDFDKVPALKDEHVSWVASTLGGSRLLGSVKSPVLQLHLPFQAYDFRYIPVETLSAIYEQFISEKKTKGAVYTPEVLADYLLSEMEWAKPLERGVRLLDPACGSGVFLVLAYRRIIEREMRRQGRRLTPEELRAILLESIFGVERERDACYVAEFGLILTLLHYTESHEVHAAGFHLPDLHNKQVFETDFFDFDGEESNGGFWQQGLRFDLVVGNPPWVELRKEAQKKDQKYVLRWMQHPAIQKECPTGGLRVAEAFSWVVTDLLNTGGVVALLLPATSLFNLESQRYRERFFAKHEVVRITNFANLRDVLFGNPDTLPAATVTYRPYRGAEPRRAILHYAPFTVDLVPQPGKSAWVITINEDDCSLLSPLAAERGTTSFWKLAMWGTHLDERNLERIERAFPATLVEVCEERQWPKACEGPQLRKRKGDDDPDVDAVPELRGKRRFDPKVMNQSVQRFSVPESALTDIPDDECHVRKGRLEGLKVTAAPHLVVSSRWLSYVAYSDEDFVVPPRHVGISATKEDADYLRALCVYLSSSLVAYYLFFRSPQWGVFRRSRSVTTSGIQRLPTPRFTPKQVEVLASLHKEMVSWEESLVRAVVATQGKLPIAARDIWSGWFLGRPEGGQPLSGQASDFVKLRAHFQEEIDRVIADQFALPEDIRISVRDFVQVRLALDQTSTKRIATRAASLPELRRYASTVKRSLDEFVTDGTTYQVDVVRGKALVECVVRAMGHEHNSSDGDAVTATDGDRTMSLLLAELSDELKEQVSQWVYVQRGLRLFDGPRVHVYKAPQRVLWTDTQAMLDAGDIIGELVAAGISR